MDEGGGGKRDAMAEAAEGYVSEHGVAMVTD